MKKIRRTLWEKGPFKLLFIYLVSYLFIYFSRLRDKVHIFHPILSQLAQSVCIIVRIKRIENKIKKIICPTLWKEGPFNGDFFYCLRDIVNMFHPILLKLA